MRQYASRSKLTANRFFSHRKSNLLEASSSREEEVCSTPPEPADNTMRYTAPLRLSGRRIFEEIRLLFGYASALNEYICTRCWCWSRLVPLRCKEALHCYRRGVLPGISDTSTRWRDNSWAKGVSSRPAKTMFRLTRPRRDTMSIIGSLDFRRYRYHCCSDERASGLLL